jgi:1-acyl-sn-glycerol-3-phosphate acyltransferase
MLSADDTRILAAAVLASIGVALAGIAAYRFHRSRYTTAQALLLGLASLFTRILWRTRIVGRWPIPRGHGVVIVSNHRGPFDPAFIALAVDRVMRWMVAKEYCEHWFMGRFLRPFGPISTSRGGTDTAATKMAVRYAQSGEIVGLFPEGRINNTSQLLLPGRLGVAMIALRARVPVVPCYIDGAPYDGTTFGCLLMPARVRVTIGHPIDLSPYYGREGDREVLEELTKRFLRELAILAGRPDFEPQVVGRAARPNGNA